MTLQKYLKIGLSVMALATASASVADMTFFRIGTGGVGGTYYPIGGLIANAISNPPGSRPCESGGSCGAPGVVAIAQSANGSVANITAIEGGQLEAGLSQSDVAYWAYSGTGVWKGQPPAKKVRAIAALYPETVHLVVGINSGIKSVSDLKGKVVSLDQPGSGTLVDARLVLAAAGIDEKNDIKAEYLKGNPASDKLKDGKLDAYFSVAGYPKSSVVDATSQGKASVANIDGAVRDTLLKENQFFAKDTIPAGTYPNVGQVETISVMALLLVSADVSEQTVYDITKALWNKQTRKLLDNGHAKGKRVTMETALDGVPVPLHPGAEKFYKEQGLVK